MTLPAVTRRPPTRPANRRRPTRAGARAEVRRVGAVVGDDLSAGLADLSADEAGVRLKTAVSVGEELAVTLVRSDGRPAARRVGTVQWYRPVAGGLYTAGLGFDRPLSLAEVAALI